MPTIGTQHSAHSCHPRRRATETSELIKLAVRGKSKYLDMINLNISYHSWPGRRRQCHGLRNAEPSAHRHLMYKRTSLHVCGCNTRFTVNLYQKANDTRGRLASGNTKSAEKPGGTRLNTRPFGSGNYGCSLLKTLEQWREEQHLRSPKCSRFLVNG